LAFIQQAFELIAIAIVAKSGNLEKAPENVFNAQVEKMFLRVLLAVEDLIERMEKHGIFERFAQ
jgi:hypothetical protein